MMTNEATNDMLLGWLSNDFSPANVERVAKWMRDTLRIGSIIECRMMLRGAINGKHPAVQCGYCLFMRDLSSAPLNAAGQCPICERFGRS